MSKSAGGAIALVGDVMLRERLNVVPPKLNATADMLRQFDFVVANLEMPLSRRGHPVPKRSNLRSDPEIVNDVKMLGINAVTLANNHVLDYGAEAMFDTIASCTGLVRPFAGAEGCGPPARAARRAQDDELSDFLCRTQDNIASCPYTCQGRRRTRSGTRRAFKGRQAVAIRF